MTNKALLDMKTFKILAGILFISSALFGATNQVFAFEGGVLDMEPSAIPGVGGACAINAQCDGDSICLAPDAVQAIPSKKICVPLPFSVNDPGNKKCGHVGSQTVSFMGIPIQGLSSSDIFYKTCDATQQCVMVAPQGHQAGDNKIGEICLPKSQLGFAKDGTDGQPACGQNQQCAIDQQCVDVIVALSAVNSTSFLDKTVHARRCVPKEDLPREVLTGDGSCATNKPCSSDKRCVYNPAQNGFSFVCVDKVHIKDDAVCSAIALPAKQSQVKVGITCGKPTTQCVWAIAGFNSGDVGFKAHYQCVDDIQYIPGNKAAPNATTCGIDADCKKIDADSPYCLYNPSTKQKQCFSQKHIYTDVAALDAVLSDPATALALIKSLSSGGDVSVKCTAASGGGKCNCPSEGVKGCAPEPNKSNSICASHFSKNPDVDDEIFLCINGVNLSSGGGTASSFVATAPTLTAERTERFAPKLEIDIPGLEFTDTVAGQSVSEGQVFTLPFLAQYINAVYRYAIGFGIVLAVVMLMYAGLRWMTSLGNAGSVSDAKSMVSNAVLGLVLLMSAYTILYVINPDLVQLKSIQIFEPNQDPFAVDDNAPSEGQKIYSKGTQCFMTTFGATKEAVKAQLVPIKIFDHTWQVHKLALPAFQKVADALKGSTYKITDPSGGTYSWRPNANNPDTMSLHSFGVAIDLNPHPNGNFKSTNPKCKTNGNLPPEIIKTFKDAGFKWGGEFKSHCDLMHFEWYGSCGK